MEDKILGLRIMQEQKLIGRIFYKDDVERLYDLEIKLREFPKQQGYCIIFGSSFFIPENNNFIGRVVRAHYGYVKDIMMKNNRCLYSDDSIKELL